MNSMLNEIKIIQTSMKDIVMIKSFFEEAISLESKNGYKVWEKFDMDILQRDIKNGFQYKIESTEGILCVFSIQYEDPHIWGERDKGNALYLHRIVANQQYKGKKIFAKVLEWTIDFAKSNAKKYVRMDTWADNIQLIEYYKTYGFQFIENFRTTNTPELPIQNQNLDLILLELKIDEIKHNCS